MSLLPKMFNHMAWADERTLMSLREMAKPPSQALNLFAHMLGAEHEWLCRIHGRTASHAIWPKISLDRCAQLASENHRDYTALAVEASGSAGQRIIAYKNSSGADRSTSLEDILIHVAEHGVYHRGQIALLVRANGGTAIPTDYIVYTREGM